MVKHRTKTCSCPACEKMRACANGAFDCYFCSKPSTEGHHIRVGGIGLKDHVPENISGLCFTCHRPGIHQYGVLEWPKRMGRPVLTQESNAEWEGETR